MRLFDKKILGDRLLELRTIKNIGQNQLAKELGMGNSSISYWENGLKEPSASSIWKMAQYFNVSADYLLGLED